MLFTKGGGGMVFWYGRRGGVRFSVLVKETPWGKTCGLSACFKGECNRVEDISPERRDVRRLARACARAQLEICHLRDAAEDWLAQIK